jgi:hypothetical protein
MDIAHSLAASFGIALALSAAQSRQSPVPLRGTWELTLHLDSARLLEGKPTGQIVIGLLHFGSEFRTFIMNRTADTTGGAFGRHELDFKPFWGGPIPPDFSTSLLAGGQSSPITEAWGRAGSRDTVVVMLNPRLSHGIVRLIGRYTTDSIVVGTWSVDSHGSQAAGRFRMRPKS